MLVAEDFSKGAKVGGSSIEQDAAAVVTSHTQPPRYVSKRQQILSVLSSEKSALFNGEIQVRHVMTASPQTVLPEESVDKICSIFARLDARHLLVCERDGRLAGVISNRDLNKRLGVTAHQIMSPNPIAVAPDSSLHGATTLMLHNHVSCVPVVENGRVCGILTTTDVMLTLQCCLRIVERLPSEFRKCPETPSPAAQVDSLQRLVAEAN